MVAANSVITKSFDENNVLLVGMSAQVKMKHDVWYNNNERYTERIN